MKTKIGFIRADYWIQFVMGLSILLCALISLVLYVSNNNDPMIFLGIYGLLALMPFGAWQVLSGLIYAFNGDRLRQIYIGVVAAYFAIGYLLFTIMKSFNIEELYAMYMIIALIIGVWYFSLTRAEFKSLDKIGVEDFENEDILDTP